MNHEIWLWIATAAYGLHALEEFMLDWKTWANKVLKLPVDWPIFYVVNALVVVLGIVAAAIGWRLPALSLAFPALMLINAVFFHILPFVVTKKFSPGLISAALYSCRSASGCSMGRQGWCLVGGHGDLGHSPWGGLMAYPVILIKLKDKPFFKQG